MIFLGQEDYKYSADWISMKQAMYKIIYYLEDSIMPCRLLSVVIGWWSRNSTSYEKCWCSCNPATCLRISVLYLEHEVIKVYKGCPGSDGKRHAILSWANL